VYKFIRFKVVYKFVKTSVHKLETVNEPNFVFKFIVSIFIIINPFRESDIFFFSIWATIKHPLKFFTNKCASQLLKL